MKKRIALLILPLILLFTLVGCESGVTYMFMPGATESALILQIDVSNHEREILESNAAAFNVNENYIEGLESTPESWSLAVYFDILLNKLPSEYFNRVFTDFEIAYPEGATRYEFWVIRENPKSSNASSDAVVETSFFFHKVTVEYDNPFNDYIKEYNDASNQFSPVSVFKKGLYIDGTLVMPSFGDAFPEFKRTAMYSDRSIDLMFSIVTPDKYESAEGFSLDINGNKYYRFSTTLDEENATVKFEYRRANTVGWNIITIAIGLCVVGGLYLFCRYGAKKRDEIRIKG